jgi:hypothetical protein
MIVDILKWDPIHSGDFPADIHPCIYMKPNIKILDLFNRSPNHKVLVKILGTDHQPYDNVVTFAIIDKSSDLYNKRDNLFDCDGLYVITLAGIVWQGYPPKNGQLELLENTVDQVISYLASSDRNIVKKSSRKEGQKIEKEEDKEVKKKEQNKKEKEMKEENTIKENFETPSPTPSSSEKVYRKKGFSNRILIFIGFCIVALLIIAFLLYDKKKKMKR